MRPKVTYWGTRNLAAEHGICPRRCPACGNTPPYGLSWQIGEDDGTDPHMVGYKCERCGGVSGLTRRTILRRIRQQAADAA